MLASESAFSNYCDSSPTVRPALFTHAANHNKEKYGKLEHRKPPLEEFFKMLVLALKFIHPQKDSIITCSGKLMYNEALKRPNLKFYEYISFIQNYLDKHAMKLKFMPTPQMIRYVLS